MKLLTHNGITQTRKKWAETLGISLPALHYRVYRWERGTARYAWWDNSAKSGSPSRSKLILGRKYKNLLTLEIVKVTQFDDEVVFFEGANEMIKELPIAAFKEAHRLVGKISDKFIDN